MLEDKLAASDMEATYDCIEEAVAKESYLMWLKEHTATSGEPSGSSAGEVGSVCIVCERVCVCIRVRVCICVCELCVGMLLTCCMGVCTYIHMYV